MSHAKHYALVGFANSGKSTVFNLLAAQHVPEGKKAAKQNVGNWSGVTVSAKKTEIILDDKSAYF